MKSIAISFILITFTFLKVFPQAYSPPKTVSSKAITKNFIEIAMVYPENELIAVTQGKVLVSFLVDSTGGTKDFEIEKGVSNALNEEAVRLIKKILWYPAIRNGKRISERQSFEIQFNIKQYNRIVKARGQNQHIQPTHYADSSNKIYFTTELDEQPKPANLAGAKSLNQYIQSQIAYPKSAWDLGISGNVKLKFIIENDGIVSNIIIDHSVGGGCDNEAIRILQNIRWIPGVKNDLHVRSFSSIDVTFKISDRKQQEIPNRQSSGL